MTRAEFIQRAVIAMLSDGVVHSIALEDAKLAAQYIEQEAPFDDGPAVVEMGLDRETRDELLAFLRKT